MNTTNSSIINQPVTYDFGETPEEVIRERHLEICQSGSGEIAGYEWIDSIPTDQLLRILEALNKAASNVEIFGQNETEDGRMRTAILKVLGVTEITEWEKGC